MLLLLNLNQRGRERKEKYKVKNIDNLKEEEITKCPTCGVLSHKSEIKKI